MDDAVMRPFVARLADSAPDRLLSVLQYQHPFSEGGLAIVFANGPEPYSSLHAAVSRAKPPRCYVAVLKRADLFLLALPRIEPFSQHEYPHIAYCLKHRGEVLYGQDLRSEIPDAMGLEHWLEGVLDHTACWFRNHDILGRLQREEHLALFGAMDQRLRFLMSVVLLAEVGEWDVALASLPDRCRDLIRDDAIHEHWRAFDALHREVAAAGDEPDRETVLEAAWHFDSVCRGLRRLYA